MENTELPEFWVDSNALHKKKILRQRRRKKPTDMKEGFENNDFKSMMNTGIKSMMNTGIDASGNQPSDNTKEEDKDTELDKELKDIMTTPKTWMIIFLIASVACMMFLKNAMLKFFAFMLSFYIFDSLVRDKATIEKTDIFKVLTRFLSEPSENPFTDAELTEEMKSDYKILRDAIMTLLPLFLTIAFIPNVFLLWKESDPISSFVSYISSFFTTNKNQYACFLDSFLHNPNTKSTFMGIVNNFTYFFEFITKTFESGFIGLPKIASASLGNFWFYFALVIVYYNFLKNSLYKEMIRVFDMILSSINFWIDRIVNKHPIDILSHLIDPDMGSLPKSGFATLCSLLFGMSILSVFVPSSIFGYFETFGKLIVFGILYLIGIILLILFTYKWTLNFAYPTMIAIMFYYFFLNRPCPEVDKPLKEQMDHTIFESIRFSQYSKIFYSLYKAFPGFIGLFAVFKMFYTITDVESVTLKFILLAGNIIMSLLLILYTGLNAFFGYKFNGTMRDPLEDYFESINPISIVRGLFYMISKQKSTQNTDTNASTDTNTNASTDANTNTNTNDRFFSGYKEMMEEYSKYKN